MAYIFNEAQKKWINALKTTRRKQGQGWLHTVTEDKKEHKYCCLGIAAICLKDQIDFKEIRSEKLSIMISSKPIYPFSIHKDLESLTGRLPEPLAKLLKIKDQEKLYTLNDTKKMTFKEIAAELKANPEKYFF